MFAEATLVAEAVFHLLCLWVLSVLVGGSLSYYKVTNLWKMTGFIVR